MARKILLADDSVTAQNMGRRILTDAGYEVVTVNNGSAALKRIAESKPDLIVLDVYMPGYGGLEVCQRIRESQETARIPVLLTVGKLEPFKPEEVRRVRADAFIVKPFEASELLTALTKLEDKIVPQPAPYKPGRFAKAMAAIEETGIPEYGDPEKGWKNRLKIPPPDRKPREDEDEDEERPVSSSESQNSYGAPASPETTAAPTAAMLRGVTAEEIAAIEAAAARFSGRAIESSETPSPAEEKPAESRNNQADSEGTAAPASEPSVEAAAN
ncbi:MAG: response regulator, partial [Acidobacteriia bacterium]|nr:response regulator [Terriglobia bacterium]